MKKFGKRVLCFVAVAAMSGSLLTGCKSQSEKTLFEYAGVTVTYKEANVYARMNQYMAEAQYGPYFGSKMWSSQVGTDKSGKKITMEDSIKNSVIDQIKQVKVLCKHAKEYNVKLTDAEKKQLKTSAQSYAKDATGKKVMKTTGANVSYIQKIYQENTLASKVQQAIIKKANVTVTDDEAKTVKVYKLAFATTTTDAKTGKQKEMSAKEKAAQKKKADDALKAINGGKDIKKVAKQYGVNSDNDESYTAGKATYGTTFETEAAKLKDNQVSGVVDCGKAYCIIKMINKNDTKAAKTSKTTLLQEKQQAAYQKVYKKWTSSADKDWSDDSIDQDLWKKVKFKYTATTAATTAASSATTTAKSK